jgi:hypothetical protein
VYEYCLVVVAVLCRGEECVTSVGLVRRRNPQSSGGCLSGAQPPGVVLLQERLPAVQVALFLWHNDGGVWGGGEGPAGCLKGGGSVITSKDVANCMHLLENRKYLSSACALCGPS